jgi:hypothetical protein
MYTLALSMQDQARDIPSVEGGVEVDGVPHHVCIRPCLREGRLIISNFRPKELRLIYEDRGPHISIDMEAVDFVSLIALEPVAFPPPWSAKPQWNGTFKMAEGRLAAEVNDWPRRMEQLVVTLKRRNTGTEFWFESLLRNGMTLKFWFFLPDAYIDLFIPHDAANAQFRQKFLPLRPASPETLAES